MKPTIMRSLSFLWLVFAAPLLAQQVDIRAFPVRGGLEAFFLQDFDISAPGTGPVIFRLEIDNQTSATLSVRLRIEVGSDRQGLLSSGETNPFNLPPGVMVPMLTNNDLFTSSGPFRLVDYRVQEGVLRDLLRDVLGTGKLPTDVYKFSFIVLIQGGGQEDSDLIEIRVTNPRKLDLIFPGGPATGNKADALQIFTNLPQFRWETDVRLCQVVVAEARPGEDPESALNQEPRLVRNFFIGGDATMPLSRSLPEIGSRIEVIPASTFQFPASGTVLTLRPGGLYYWRVIGFIETSSGTLPLESEIFCFRVADLEQIGPGSEQFLIVMRALLGQDYDSVFGEGGELEGYLPKRMTFGGREVTATEILTRLTQLQKAYAGYSIE